MPNSLADKEVISLLADAAAGHLKLHASPDDWRKQWIYQIVIDRFNNPHAKPNYEPYNAPYGSFQGGSYSGVKSKLAYLKSLGVGTLWLSPTLKNCQYDHDAYHGYGIQNFLAAEPRYADHGEQADDELRALVDAAHAHGMYVIFDIVFHHTGNVFAYVKDKEANDGSRAVKKTEYWNDADWSDEPMPIRWRDKHGKPNPEWNATPHKADPDAAVMPLELRRNELFVRKGTFNNDVRPEADFYSFKSLDGEFCDENGRYIVSDIMERAYQYVIARFDVDGFRIDTLKFMSPRFERSFVENTKRFAKDAGKKNFFIFGEVWDNEEKIAKYLRNGGDSACEPFGVDAVQDYPLYYVLPDTLKGMGKTPADIARMYDDRKRIEAENGADGLCDLASCYVSFLDNHDVPSRFGWAGGETSDEQVIVGLTCLFCLAGIPSVYYGTEQGLDGHKDEKHQDDSMVRESLWGKPDAFDQSNPIYQELKAIAKLRAEEPALHRGGQFIRPVSADGIDFAVSDSSPGVLVISRIVDGQEVICAANLSKETAFEGFTIIDGSLHENGAKFKLLYGNKSDAAKFRQQSVECRGKGEVHIVQICIDPSDGPALILPLKLQPMEVQVLKRK